MDTAIEILGGFQARMYSEVQNINDRKLVFGVTKDLVGVNGIDPVRQGIDPYRPDPYRPDLEERSIEERSIVVYPE